MNGIIRPFFSSTIALVAALGSGVATIHAQEEINNVDELVSKLHILNQEEIQAGKLASEKGRSDGVKEYGRKLMADHQKSDEEVKQLAQKKQIEWNEKAELPADKKQMLERLRRLDGEEFDREFLREMESGHQKAIAMVSGASESLKDSDARDLATKTLPLLEQHLDHAKRLQQTSN